MAGTPPPAGWYNDPAGSAGKRWWDGERWTDKVKTDDAPQAPVDHVSARALLTGQKGGDILIIFSAFAAAVSAVIVAVYFYDASNATRFSTPNTESLTIAALLMGASSILFTWGVYRIAAQVDEMYTNTLAQHSDLGQTVAEAMTENAKAEHDSTGP